LLFENDGRLMRQIVWIPIAKLYIDVGPVLLARGEQKRFILLTWFIGLFYEMTVVKSLRLSELFWMFYTCTASSFSKRFRGKETKNGWTRYLPYWFLFLRAWMIVVGGGGATVLMSRNSRTGAKQCKLEL
jgi:hypothetical protein